MAFFTELGQIIYGFTKSNRGITRVILRKKKKKQIWMYHMPDLRLFYKATVIKIVWYGTKQPYRSKEYNREPRNKPMYLWSINLWQRQWKYRMESVFTLSSISVTSKIGEPHMTTLPTFIRSWREQRNTRKASTSASLTMLKLLTAWITTVKNVLSDGNTRPPYLPPEKPVCRLRSNNQN